jgi:hypothetical protein
MSKWGGCLASAHLFGYSRVIGQGLKDIVISAREKSSKCAEARHPAPLGHAIFDIGYSLIPRTYSISAHHAQFHHMRFAAVLILHPNKVDAFGQGIDVEIEGVRTG